VTRLIEGSLTAESRGFISIATLAEVVRVMSSNYHAALAAVADIVEGL
jgi:predicted nucleic-acid-binding protein